MSEGVSICSLLAARDTTCADLGGQMAEALDMLPTWRRLWNDFSAYVDIRDRLVCRRGDRAFYASSHLVAELLEHLVDVGLLDRGNGRYWVSGPRAAQRLRGGWLEELGAVAAVDSGCDEVRFSQRLLWRSRHSDGTCQNEIDVLARRRDSLVFVSCKALTPMAAVGGEGPDRLFDAMKELAYWRQHFGAGRGRAVLLTTADFIDEEHGRYRNGGLIERAEVLGVRLVSADVGDYEGLVSSFSAVLASS